MAIAVGTNTLTISDAGSSVVQNVPTGVTNGDFLLWAVDSTSATTPTLPTGWTLWQSGTTTAESVMVCYRVASSEPASYTMAVTSGRSVGIMFQFTGVDTTTPKDATVPAATAGTTTLTFPSITTVTAGAWIIAIGSITVAAAVTNTTLSSANLDSIDQQGTNGSAGSTNSVMAIGHSVRASTGAFTPTMTSSNASVRTLGINSALRPAAGGAAAANPPTVRRVRQAVNRSATY